MCIRDRVTRGTAGDSSKASSEREEYVTTPTHEKGLKKLMTVHRTQLHMTLASQPQHDHLQLRWEETKPLYDFLLGKDMLGREPPVPVHLILDAYMEFWKLLAIESHAPGTKVLDLFNKKMTDSMFWNTNVFWVERRQPGGTGHQQQRQATWQRPTWNPQEKGPKGKGKGAKSWDSPSPKATGKGDWQQSGKGAITSVPSIPAGGTFPEGTRLASFTPDGKRYYCWPFAHGKCSQPYGKSCGKSHNCAIWNPETKMPCHANNHKAAACPLLG